MSKQSNLLDFLKTKNVTQTDSPTPSTSTKISEETSEKRRKVETFVYKYQDKFINYGFTCIQENEIDLPQCVICGTVLANASLKTNKLLRHLEANHNEYKDKPAEFFVRKLKNLKANEASLTKFVVTDKKYLKCSFFVALHIAKCKKAYNLG